MGGTESIKPEQVERSVICDCLKTMAGYWPGNWGKHHHKQCPKYKTEKFPYLLYYEEAINAWTFAPDRVENLVDLEEGDDMEIQFKCKKFTDAEIDTVPED